jgi:ABC-type branched-subunit amino acid transport system substrate-binding protein
MKVRTIATASAVLALTLLSASCSSKAADPKTPTGNAPVAGGVKTDIGVNDKTITLGVLTDFTGPFAVLGKSITQSAQLYFEQVNSRGGICNRQVELIIKDHGYDVQKAVGLYADVEPKVVGFEQLLGSPMVAGLLPTIKEDKVFVSPVSWASTLLANDNLAIMGATYDIEMINGIDYLMKEKGLKSGDTIAHIYFEGEYGANGFMGSKFAAEKAGLKLQEVKIKPTDEDMTSQVTSIKASGAKAILLTTGPKQAASATAVAKSLGLDVPVLGSSPTYTPALLATPAGPALEANFLLVTSYAPFSADTPAAKELAAAYKAKFPGGVPNAGIPYGYGAAHAYGEVLTKACANGDLTRQGLVDASKAITSIDTGGLIASLDFSKPGAPPSRETLILVPDKKSEGGLKVVKDLFTTDNATAYKAPAEK